MKIHVANDGMYDWWFDGERVYIEEAEDTPGNGYSCDTEQEAHALLVEYGYIEEHAPDAVKLAENNT